MPIGAYNLWMLLGPPGAGHCACSQILLFIVLASNASSAADFFCVPPNRVVELGAQIEV